MQTIKASVIPIPTLFNWKRTLFFAEHKAQKNGRCLTVRGHLSL